MYSIINRRIIVTICVYLSFLGFRFIPSTLQVGAYRNKKILKKTIRNLWLIENKKRFIENMLNFMQVSV